jgi:predicted ATPase with chaperone activity
MRLSIPTMAVVAFTAANLMPALDAPDANAQSQAPSSKPASPGLSGANISEQKLDAEAAAIQQVAGVKQNYQQRMATASPSEQQKIAAEGSDAMKKAVIDHGLSVEEYTSILQVAQNDPAVHQKLVDRLTPPGANNASPVSPKPGK